MEIIADCIVTSERFGVVTNLPMDRYVIYAQPISELAGFRTRMDYYRDSTKTYWELGFFADLLYEGDFNAWAVLTSPEDYLNLNNFQNFNLEVNLLITRKLVSNLIEGSKEYLKKVNEKFVDYGNILYICALKAMIAESILTQGTFQVKKPDIIQRLYDCKFKQKAAIGILDKLYDNLDKLMESCTLPNNLDFVVMNKHLLTLRNIKL